MLQIGYGSANPTILVIDDSPELRCYFRVVLQSEGYHVVCACDGIEGVQFVKEGSPASAVVLDMQMPGMDGLRTLRCLRELRPDLKVVICSGVEDSGTIRDAMMAGAQAYLVKPVQRLYLSAAIRTCFSEKRPAIMSAQGTRVITIAAPLGCRPN